MRSRWHALALVALMVTVGCGLQVTLPTPDDGCPRSVAEAAALENGREIVLATGALIRFVPSPRLDFRGYDVNLMTRNGKTYHETLFLRTAERIAGVREGEYVLVVAEATDRSLVVVPGRCPALVPITEEEASEPWRE